MYNVFTCARDHEFVSRCSFDVITESSFSEDFFIFSVFASDFSKETKQVLWIGMGRKIPATTLNLQISHIKSEAGKIISIVQPKSQYTT